MIGSNIGVVLQLNETKNSIYTEKERLAKIDDQYKIQSRIENIVYSDYFKQSGIELSKVLVHVETKTKESGDFFALISKVEFLFGETVLSKIENGDIPSKNNTVKGINDKVIHRIESLCKDGLNSILVDDAVKNNGQWKDINQLLAVLGTSILQYAKDRRKVVTVTVKPDKKHTIVCDVRIVSKVIIPGHLGNVIKKTLNGVDALKGWNAELQKLLDANQGGSSLSKSTPLPTGELHLTLKAFHGLKFIYSQPSISDETCDGILLAELQEIFKKEGWVGDSKIILVRFFEGNQSHLVAWNNRRPHTLSKLYDTGGAGQSKIRRGDTPEKINTNYDNDDDKEKGKKYIPVRILVSTDLAPQEEKFCLYQDIENRIKRVAKNGPSLKYELGAKAQLDKLTEARERLKEKDVTMGELVVMRANMGDNALYTDSRVFVDGKIIGYKAPKILQKQY